MQLELLVFLAQAHELLVHLPGSKIARIRWLGGTVRQILLLPALQRWKPPTLSSDASSANVRPVSNNSTASLRKALE